ncbi:DNA internalization-related competence protein ComEC/Rec2 [Thiomicrorhabdus sp. zzn3]|uniref:DNA internalization-related competence protein ComEC/Rec2 n=1 Tax=Thiomicrorhabdus sp. zzn3 TaxID=3039775 RepID=UPI002436F342|nr:DNA internalization-related competence protein ComEC/Rec2 [Thiomicrorhabdus sp. zzn3]MDG6777822.1 DNA internalization-related competence protein ComEC/Rec2 [Thiomicrorhabdus sp. zzn3]
MFIGFVIAFVLSVYGFYQFSERPGLWPPLLVFLAFAALSLLLALQRRGAKWLALAQNRYTPLLPVVANVVLGIIIGWCWAFGQTFFSAGLPEENLNRPILIQGEIVGLPAVFHDSQRVRIQFNMEVLRIAEIDSEQAWSSLKHSERSTLSTPNPKLQLNWYLPLTQFSDLTVPLKPGQVWQLPVKLKANHASMNLASLDYESWLFQNRIAAKGYVLNRAEMGHHLKRLQASDGGWRFQVSQRLQQAFAGSPFAGLYEALSYGDRSHISDAQWQVLQNTGTIHLMAISGLHMGIVAALGFWLFKGLWWLGLYRIERLNLPMLGASGALLFASFYLMLAGFSIPTQRAYLMVLAVILFLLVKRRFRPWPALALAALLVVLWDSRSVLSHGFWLSFLAVALIFAVIQRPGFRQASRWQQLLWIQVVLTLGLAPYLLYAFHFLPLYSLPANLIAVPLVSLVLLPLLLLVSVVALFSVPSAAWLTQYMDDLWQWLWQGLTLLALPDSTTLPLGGLSLELLLIGYLTLFVLLMARSNRIKVFATAGLLAILLAVFFNQTSQRAKTGQAWVHLLDVGQGLAVVIETANHVMVYDTGAKWGDKMDGAKLAILPLLRSKSWNHIDQVMVSHSDLDHAGGLERLLKEMPVRRVTSGQPAKVAEMIAATQANKAMPKVNPCHSGRHWEWDGVVFEVLYPGLSEVSAMIGNDNDHSCVLKVSASNQSVLLTGDLSQKAEEHLINRYRQQGEVERLQADLLVAGHHGSRHSTGEQWLKVVNPKVVLFSSGYRNRYGFPNQQTVQRLKPGTSWLNTACSGGIGYLLGASQPEGKIGENGVSSILLPEPNYEARKQRQKWYHHQCLPQGQGKFYQ